MKNDVCNGNTWLIISIKAEDKLEIICSGVKNMSKKSVTLTCCDVYASEFFF